MKLSGTLKFTDVEGGTWLFVTDDRRTFQLPKDPGAPAGTRVEIDGEPDPQGVSFQMGAPMLRVRNVRRL
jgi:hypothetical protein